MRVITLNVNGIRSAERKGFARWLARAEPWDVVCLQEIKAGPEDIPRPLVAPRKAHATFVPAQKKGYSGVALYAKTPPRVSIGWCAMFQSPHRITSRPAARNCASRGMNASRKRNFEACRCGPLEPDGR